MSRAPIAADQMIDVCDIEAVDITISDDHQTVWVTLPEGCVLRVRGIKTLSVKSKGCRHIYYNNVKKGGA